MTQGTEDHASVDSIPDTGDVATGPAGVDPRPDRDEMAKPVGLTTVTSLAAPVGDEPGPGQGSILELEAALGCKVIVYFAASGAAIARDNDAQPVRDLLNVMGRQSRLALVLQSSGGDADAAQYLLGLLHEYADTLDIYVHTFAVSAATLMCLGADRLFMSHGAELGPVDPQVPVDADLLIPVARSEESNTRVVHIPAAVVREFLEFVGVVDGPTSALRRAVDIKRLRKIIGRHLNPWVIGWYEHEVHSLRVYAHRNLRSHLMAADATADDIEQTIDFFLGHYPSHNASILRNEAREVAHLPVLDVTEQVELILHDLHAAYREQFRVQPIARMVETANAFEAYTPHTSRTCRNCYEQLAADHRFCTACGVESYRVCVRCEEPMLTSWAFCGNCGEQVGS